MGMRQRSTKERRQQRVEFAYMYRSEIAEFIKGPGWPLPRKTYEWFNTVARTQLNYKATTAAVDIFLILKRDYLKYIQNGHQ